MRRSVCERVRERERESERARMAYRQTDSDEMKIVVTARERGTVMR